LPDADYDDRTIRTSRELGRWLARSIVAAQKYATLGPAVLHWLLPKPLAASKAARKATQELADDFGIPEAEITAIVYPPQFGTLLQDLHELTQARLRRPVINVLRASSDDDLAFSDEERARIHELAQALDRATLSERDGAARAKVLGINRRGVLSVSRDFWDKSLNTDTGLSRARFVGEICVNLYRFLAARIPAQRRQERGQRKPKYNLRAMRYTATLVSGAYGWLGLRTLSTNDIQGHVRRSNKAVT
jgi:hypothetical protein